MSFPIKGEYNDYGGIENVEKDANVEAIEKYFKLPVEDLVGLDFRDHPLNKKSKLLNEFGIKFDGNLLKKLGFKGHDNSFYFLEEEGFTDSEKWMVVLKPNEYKGEHKRAEISYDIVEVRENDTIVHEGKAEHDGYYIFKSFRSHWKDLTGWELGVASEDQHLIDIFNFMGGMFFHRDVYEAMMKEGPGKDHNSGTLATAELSQYIMEKLGFELYEDLKNSHGEVRMHHKDLPGWYFDVSGQHYSKVFKVGGSTKLNKDRDKVKKAKDLSVVGAVALKKALRHHAAYDLDISVLYNETKAGREFDEIRNKLVEHDKSEKNHKKYLAKLKKTKDGSPEQEELYNLLTESRLMGLTHPMRSPYSDSGFDCRSWPFFKEIYEEAFRKGTVKQDWIEWNTFMPSAYSANIHWAPAMNGEQHGNTHESLKMHKAALEVLDKRLKKEKEYEDENDDEPCSWYHS